MRCARLLLVAIPTLVYAVAREFRVYRSLEAQADVDLPPDYSVPAEFVVGRLMYPSNPNFGFFRFGSGNWLEGGTPWAVDYPRGDRRYAAILQKAHAHQRALRRSSPSISMTTMTCTSGRS